MTSHRPEDLSGHRWATWPETGPGPWDAEQVVPEVPDDLPDRTVEVLTGYLGTALTHQQRGDTKSSGGLFGLVATLVAGLVTPRPGAGLSIPETLSILAAYAGIIATAAAMLWAIRPAMSGDTGLPRWARISPDQIVADAAQESAAQTTAARRIASAIRLHARIAVRRYRWIRTSVDMALITLALAALARALTVL
jgi:hypothetical protein